MKYSAIHFLPLIQFQVLGGLEPFPAAIGKVYSEQVTGLTQRDRKPFTLMDHRLTCMSLHGERKDPGRTSHREKSTQRGLAQMIVGVATMLTSTLIY